MGERAQSLRTTVPPTVVAVAAVAYATIDASRLSPTVQSLLLALLALGLLVDANAEGRSSSARALGSLVAAGVLAYLLAEYVGPVLVVSLAFLGVPLLATWWTRATEPGRMASLAPRIRVAVAVLLLVTGVGLVGYDLAGPGVTSEEVATTEGGVELPRDERSPSETDTVFLDLRETRLRNEFPLSRSVDVPAYDVCVAGDGAGVVQELQKRTLHSTPLADGVLEGHESGSVRLYLVLTLRGGPGDHVDVQIERGRGCDVERDRLTLRYWRTD